MALRLVRERDGLGRELIRALTELCDNVRTCSLCGGIADTQSDPCRLCSDPSRDDALLCVVEEPADIAVIERAGCMRGRYHALMGRLSPTQRSGADDLRIAALLRRLDSGAVREVILALNTNVESDATASFVGELLAGRGLRVTRLAFGIPAGSGIAWSDAVTLERAMNGRQPVGGR
jgi:recombination protein RecR